MVLLVHSLECTAGCNAFPVGRGGGRGGDGGLCHTRQVEGAKTEVPSSKNEAQALVNMSFGGRGVGMMGMINLLVVSGGLLRISRRESGCRNRRWEMGGRGSMGVEVLSGRSKIE